MADFRDEEEFEQNDLDNYEEKTATDGSQDAVEKERSVASTEQPAEPALEAAPEAESEYTLSDKPETTFEPTPQSVQSEIRRTRHRMEIPLYIICIIGGVAAFIYNIISTINGGGLEKELKNEVKLRKDDSYGAAREFVTRGKQEKILKTAGLWLSQNDCELQPRFDVIEVYAPQGTQGAVRIEHLEDAFN